MVISQTDTLKAICLKAIATVQTNLAEGQAIYAKMRALFCQLSLDFVLAILPLKEIAMKRNPIAKALANSNLKPQIIPNKKAYKRKPKHVKQGVVSDAAIAFDLKN